ncbi:MAG: ATP-binding protein [Parcubacteria group bacterium]
MKLELTIKADYLPEWKIWEGVRELVQNAIDAQTEHGATMTIRHRDGNVLVIENEGVVLPHEALLLGHTTKTDRSDMRGKFGEGLKLGVLALVREGLKIKIRSGDEVWVPSIMRSDKFDAKVLCFQIATGRKAEQRVQVEVHGINAEAWLFLFLGDGRRKPTRVKTSFGSLLLDPESKGMLYCKGIHVQNDHDLAYGYDFDNVEVDRDRRMIDKWSLQYQMSQIWLSALGRRPDLVDSFQIMLDENPPDCKGIGEYTAKYMPDSVVSAVTAEFERRHGSNAFPVDSLAESEDVGHLGKRGIVVGDALGHILRRRYGTIDEIKARYATEVTRTYSWHELSDLEQTSLKRAVDTVADVTDMSLETVEIVDFRDENLLGLHHANHGMGAEISLAKRILGSRRETLRVLVHEVAHREGGDGSKGHVSTIERIWADIVEALG